MRKLNTYVHVGDVRYGPEDVVPDEVAAKITNPDVWERREDPAPAADQTPPQTPTKVTAEISPVTNPPVVDPDRPRGNASREEWATYASGKDIQVTGQMNRDDIRSAVEQWDARQGNKQDA
jgi:hypothetical protein